MTHLTEKSGDSREPKWISDKTKIQTSIALAASVCLTLIGIAWTARGYIENKTAELAEHFNRMERGQEKMQRDLAETRDSLNDKWSASQMIIWAAQLDKANRGNDDGAGINVPDPSVIVMRPRP